MFLYVLGRGLPQDHPLFPKLPKMGGGIRPVLRIGGKLGKNPAVGALEKVRHHDQGIAFKLGNVGYTHASIYALDIPGARAGWPSLLKRGHLQFSLKANALPLLAFFWPRSLETRVQLPRCHSAAIHFHDLVVSAGQRRTRAAVSGSPLRRFAHSAAELSRQSLPAVTK